MRVTSITVTAGRKINIGDYNSIHLELTMTAEPDEGEPPEVVREQLWTDVTLSLRAQTAPFLKRRQEQLQEVLSGLPLDVQETMTHANPRTD